MRIFQFRNRKKETKSIYKALFCFNYRVPRNYWRKTWDRGRGPKRPTNFFVPQQKKQILGQIRQLSAGCAGCANAKKLSASGGFAFWSGALPLEPARSGTLAGNSGGVVQTVTLNHGYLLICFLRALSQMDGLTRTMSLSFSVWHWRSQSRTPKHDFFSIACNTTILL